MKEQLLKKLTAIICILTLLLPITSEVFAKIDSTDENAEQVFGIVEMHKSRYLDDRDEKNYGYKVNNKISYRIFSGADDADGYVDTVFCLDQLGKFPQESSEDGSKAPGTYKSLGPDNTETKLPTLKSTTGEGKTEIGEDNAKKILWLMRNAVLPEDSPGIRDVKLAKIFEQAIKESEETQNPLTVEYIKNVLTEDDLVFATQATIWKLTNPTPTPPLYLGKMTPEADYNSLSGISPGTEDGRQGRFIEIMIEYYESMYGGTTDIVIPKTDAYALPKIIYPDKKLIFTDWIHRPGDPEPPAVGPDEELGTTIGNYIYVGPFKIESSEAGKDTVDYSINLTFATEGGETIPAKDVEYYIRDDKTATARGYNLVKEEIEGKNFYVVLRKGTSIRDIKFELKSAKAVSETDSTLWVTEDESTQPLISIDREESEIDNVSHTYTFGTNYQRRFDISLRKHIKCIYRKNAMGYEIIEGEYKRVDTMTAIVKDLDDTSAVNQCYYLHKKNTLNVEVGDIVVYELDVFNEGKYPVKISQITDYAPASGLTLLNDTGKTTPTIPDHRVDYSGFKVSDPVEVTPDGSSVSYKKIIIDAETDNAINNVILPGRDIDAKEEPKGLSLRLQFLVTEEARGKTLVNIAEVTGFLGQNDPLGTGTGSTDFAQQIDTDSTINNLVSALPKTQQELDKYKGNAKNDDDLGKENYYYFGQEDDDDFEKIRVPGEEKMDLALRKSAIALNGSPLDRQRDPNPSPLLDGSDTTSIFTDVKNPGVPVKVGDKVTYSIRVFNEGGKDGYATRITDYIPEGLGFLPFYSDNEKYGWVTDSTEHGEMHTLGEVPNSNKNFSSSEFKDSSLPLEQQQVVFGRAAINTEILKSDDDKNKLEKFDPSASGMDKYDIHTIQITCIVIGTGSTTNTTLRNVAAITKYEDENKDEVTEDGTDSHSNNDLTNFKTDDHEDDEDYEHLTFEPEIEKAYDLALKKYVTAVADATNTNKTIPNEQNRNTVRVENVDALKNRPSKDAKADAVYKFGNVNDKNATPVKVSRGDYVTYNIRVYNEGEEDAYVKDLADNIPAGLTFLSDSSINTKFGWTKVTSTSGSWNDGVHTTVLKDTKIPAFDPSKENAPEISNTDPTTGITTGMQKGVSYAEIKIELKVDSNASATPIKNIAEILQHDDGKEDADSDPNNKDESEDDEDFDVIIPSRFDLALRKFIVKIGNKDITGREPVVDTTDLDSGKSTTAKYKHPKEEDVPIVVKGQEVIYKIRVYNEGTEDGYAAEIKDDIPAGLKFLPDHKVNKNVWIMLDSSGKETTDASKAVSIYTKAKDKDHGVDKTGGDPSNPYYKTNSNLILAYDPTRMKDGPDYVDIEVAFEVIKDVVTDGKTKIINTAEIRKETDASNKEVKDDDSTPNDNDLNQDDIDREYLQLKYFDLSLKKFVSQVIVTEDGVTKVTKTNYTGDESPEPVVKVELNRKKLSKTSIKYVYTIKVTNEGEIPGYATEITDRIPAGLEFHAEDNKKYGWTVKGSGIIITDYLKDKLIQPGKSETLEVVLRWKNSATNLGLKINRAEISADKNEYDVPDIDSKPGNNVEGEDDQDDAPVLLSIETGSAPMYIALITIVIGIITSGLYLIYKYVVKK